MTLVDLLAYVAFPVGFGTALDAAAKPKLKARISKWSSGARGSTQYLPFSASTILDRIFGAKLFSFRAVLITAAISIISAILGYIFVLLTSAEIANDIAIFSNKSRPVDIISFVSTTILVILGDTICFIQTRIFIKAAESYRNSTVITVLLFSDTFASLTIFVMFFAFAASVVFVISFADLPDGGIYRTDTLSPTEIVEIIDESSSAEQKVGNGGPEFLAYQALSAYKPENAATLNSIAATQKSLEEKYYHVPAGLVDYSASEKCLTKNLESSVFSAEVFSHYYDSVMEGFIVASALRPKSFDFKRAQINLQKKLYHRSLHPVNGCALPVVEVRKTLNANRWLKIMHPLDIFSYSASYSAASLVTASTDKFSGYVSYDPYANIPSVLSQITNIRATSFLGIKFNEKLKSFSSYLASMKSDQTRYLNLPLSPYMLSSLLSSLVFAVFCVLLVILFVARSISRLIESARPSFDVENAPFTICGLALSALALSLLTAADLLNALWRLVV